MKKILMILLTVAVFVSALAFSVCASDDRVTDLNGTEWIIPSGWTYTDSFKLVTCYGTYKSYVTTEDVKEGIFDFIKLGADYNDVRANYITFSGSRIGLSNVHTIEILFTASCSDAALINWLYTNGQIKQTECDGSSCPVADFNTDGVCDTCGNTLAYSVLRSYTPDNYPYNLPPMPVGFGGESKYIVLDPNNDGTIEMYTFTPYSDMPVTTYVPKITQYGSIGVETFDSIGAPVDVTMSRYRLGNDSQWYYIDGTSDAVHIFADTTKAKMIYTSMPIYNYDGTLFFPLPLWAQVEQVTQGQMETVQPQVGGTMQILVLCGVGLMACLVVLSLFGKRSLISLKR